MRFGWTADARDCINRVAAFWVHDCKFVRYLMVLLLAGCAASDYVWYKPGATAQSLEADQSECTKQASATLDWGSRALLESRRASCMREKDWRLKLKE